MAYDEDLALRVRGLLATEPAVSEQQMFGGLGLLVSGNLAVAVGSDDILVRVGEDAAPGLEETTGAARAKMGTRTMKGWMSVPVDLLADDAGLADWVARGASYARSLPPK